MFKPFMLLFIVRYYLSDNNILLYVASITNSRFYILPKYLISPKGKGQFTVCPSDGKLPFLARRLNPARRREHNGKDLEVLTL
jgi:hypothetical protein